jgi:hypothetical protein
MRLLVRCCDLYISSQSFARDVTVAWGISCWLSRSSLHNVCFVDDFSQGERLVSPRMRIPAYINKKSAFFKAINLYTQLFPITHRLNNTTLIQLASAKNE